MEKENYAPVYITTLNRFEHFKRCLESLEKCRGASHTDVYVGLDYPPSEKYIEGWKKIDRYLIEKEKYNRFKHLYVRRRDHNCGICKRGSNALLLIEEICRDHDRYIGTEDDNEFSLDFLEYVNWGLETFKDDKRVFAICGFTEVEINTSDYNVYAYHRFNGWGMGTWASREKRIDYYRNPKVWLEELSNTPWYLFFTEDVIHKAHLLGMLASGQIWGDTIVGSLPKEERYVILPTTSKVRNYGSDGSGQHGKGNKSQNERFSNITFINNIHFEPIYKESVFRPDISEIYNKMLIEKRDYKLRAKCAIIFLMWKLFRFNVYSCK